MPRKKEFKRYVCVEHGTDESWLYFTDTSQPEFNRMYRRYTKKQQDDMDQNPIVKENTLIELDFSQECENAFYKGYKQAIADMSKGVLDIVDEYQRDASKL